jgi:CHC2-type zinc finger protein
MSSPKNMSREEIIAANPIDQYLIARGYKLKRNGKGWTCRCPNPDHDDKNPSFSIFDNDHACKCHSCGLKGSVIDIHMALTGCDVATAFAFFSPNEKGKALSSLSMTTATKKGGRAIRLSAN